MSTINPAHLPYLRILCEVGTRPVEWSGSGPDRTLPPGVSKRLEADGYIERQGDLWAPTTKGRNAVGRV